MLRTTTNFNTENAKLSARPVVVITIAGLTNTYSNGTYLSAGATVKKLLKNVSILGGDIDLVNFKTSSFGIDFEILDKSNTFFNEVVANEITGAKVTIQIGFESLAIADFQTLPVCYVNDFEVQPDHITFKISARDRKHKEFKRKIFRSIGVTELSAALTAGATTVNVNDNSAFQAANSANWGTITTTYIKVDEEIMIYTVKGGNQFTVTRAALGTTAATHTAGAICTELYFIDDSPVEFLMQILTGFNHLVGTPEVFDQALPAGWGLDFDVDDDIDRLQMLNEYYNWSQSPSAPTWQYQWLISEEQDAEKFIIDHIMKVIPGFFIYTENALLGIKIWDFRATNEGEYYRVLVDDNSNVSQISSDDKLVTAFSSGEVYNGGTMRWDNIVTQEYTKAISVFGRKEIIARPFILNLPLTLHTDQLFLRYFKNSTRNHAFVSFDSFRKNWIMQIGDVVALTNPKLLDFGAGTTGWTKETIQIMKQTIAINAGQVSCRFEGISYDNRTDIDSDGGNDDLRIEIALDDDGDIDDADLTFDATDSVVTQAADAYYLVQTLVTNLGFHLVQVTIEADLPGGADSEEFVNFSIYAGELNVADVDGTNHYNDKKPVYYNASWTGKLQQKITLYIPNNSYDIEIVKVDYYGRSAGVGDRLSNVKLKQVIIEKHTITINETT